MYVRPWPMAAPTLFHFVVNVGSVSLPAPWLVCWNPAADALPPLSHALLCVCPKWCRGHQQFLDVLSSRHRLLHDSCPSCAVSNCSRLHHLAQSSRSQKLAPLGYKAYWFGKGHTGYLSMAHLPTSRGFLNFTGFLGGAQSYTSDQRWMNEAPLLSTECVHLQLLCAVCLFRSPPVSTFSFSPVHRMYAASNTPWLCCHERHALCLALSTRASVGRAYTSTRRCTVHHASEPATRPCSTGYL